MPVSYHGQRLLLPLAQARQLTALSAEKRAFSRRIRLMLAAETLSPAVAKFWKTFAVVISGFA
jgi:hypothetical protein